MTLETTSEATRLLDLFPLGATTDKDGELIIGGCKATNLAEEFGTPLMVVDELALRDRARRYADGLASRWPNSQVVWASKSFPCTAIYRIIQQEGLAIDVAGGGELVMALAAGTDPARIVLHGNAKTSAELEMAIRAGVGTIVIDNFDDIDRLENLVVGEQNVLIRVIPGIETDNHQALATGDKTSKFGLSLDDTQIAINRIAASDKLRMEGLHVHIGSQILEAEPFARAVESISALGEFATYDLGGGLGVRYTYDDHPPSIEEYLDTVVGAAKRLLPSNSRILIEPGRSMVAESTVTLYSVVTVKHNGARTFVAVDGGMGDNLEVSLYGQRFEATVAARVGEGDAYTLVGRHCESGDQLIDSIALREPSIGDVIAVPVTGAYCFTMANNYNGARRPPVVLVHGGTAQLVLRRESYDDLLRRDLA